MAHKTTALSLVLGTAIVVTLAAAPAFAADNPFASQQPSKGYMIAETDKAKEAKCGDMKSSTAKADNAKPAEAKCGDMKSGTEKTDAANSSESKCGDMKDMRKKHKKHMKRMMDMEGKCGSSAKDSDNNKSQDKSDDKKATDKKASEKKCGAM